MVTAEKRLEGLVLCRPVLERRLRGVGLGTVQRRFGSWMDEQGREVGVSLVTTRREETVSGGLELGSSSWNTLGTAAGGFGRLRCLRQVHTPVTPTGCPNRLRLALGQSLS